MPSIGARTRTLVERDLVFLRSGCACKLALGFEHIEFELGQAQASARARQAHLSFLKLLGRYHLAVEEGSSDARSSAPAPLGQFCPAPRSSASDTIAGD